MKVWGFGLLMNTHLNRFGGFSIVDNSCECVH